MDFTNTKKRAPSLTMNKIRNKILKTKEIPRFWVVNYR